MPWSAVAASAIGGKCRREMLAASTREMLAASTYVRELKPRWTLIGYGQEINGETFAICTADMLVKGGHGRQVASAKRPCSGIAQAGN
jgi:hypothetical protein